MLKKYFQFSSRIILLILFIPVIYLSLDFVPAPGGFSEIKTSIGKINHSNKKSVNRDKAAADNINWPQFLSRCDMVWNRLPENWESGAFMGNALLGANVYTTTDSSRLMWRIGRSDVVYMDNRIPVGDFVLNTTGKLEGCKLRLDLWNAELRGSIKTSLGEIKVQTFTHTKQLVQVIILKPDPSEKNISFTWKPGLAANPRTVRDKKPIPENEVNPGPVSGIYRGLKFSFQPLRTGGGHATVWKDSIDSGGGTHIILLSVGYSTISEDDALGEAESAVIKAEREGVEKLTASHRDWWHKFYQASFLSIPDSRMESFYWIQLYKMASATRKDRPVLDLMGPWFRSTPWPRIWWNLNIQLTYWPQLVSNHLDLGESLMKALDDHKEALSENASPYGKDSYAIGRSSGYDLKRHVLPEVGDLTWALHNYWLEYKFSMDTTLLRNRLFPLLKGSINYYLHILKKGDDGYLHIPFGLSPEYPHQPDPDPDCNYDLALLRWGCRTLLNICDTLNINDPLIPQWKNTLKNLLPYPTDKNGFMISASVPFAVSHRHYSHMLMVYPLYIFDIGKPGNRALVIKSLNHWMSMPEALRGYSYTGAASIYALLGKGNDAEKYLNLLLDGQRFIIQPNTMYTEAGPVIETPLSAAKAIQDMILTGWGGAIRVFPGIPDNWKNISFKNLRTKGAFLVSAVRKDGRTIFINIKSLAGQPCRLITDMNNPASNTVKVVKISDNEYFINLKKGENVMLTPNGVSSDVRISPVSGQKNRENYYGLH